MKGKFRRPVSRIGFTLIELLVVIAIISILSLVVVLTLNPLEILRQGRDSVRLADISTIHTAMGSYAVDQSEDSIGNASTTYVSIADSTTTCANLGLPPVSGGWAYSCVSSSTLRNVDGTGWIPVDFTAASFGAPFSQLPVDPINATTSGHYYTYTPGGSWKIAGVLESRRESSRQAQDGGIDPTVIEVGTNLSLPTVAQGLSAYWKFNENTGTSAADSSGMGRNATLTNGATWGSPKSGQSALALDGINDYADTGTNLRGYGIDKQFTISVWIHPTTACSGYCMIAEDGTGFSAGSFYFGIGPSNTVLARVDTSAGGIFNDSISTGLTHQDRWSHLVLVYDGTRVYVYANASLVWSAAQTGSIISGNTSLQIGRRPAGSLYFTGRIDDMRIYSKALDSADILNLYTYGQ